MTNPNDAVGTNAAYDGRTSVNAFNDNLAAYSAGIVSGWACVPNSGLTVSLGGNGSIRDVAVAEDNAGNKTTINNISGSPIDVTLSAAPGSNSRIDLIVAYVDNPPQGLSTVADNPSACGIIKVNGTASVSPVAPNDTAIRTAITADGASGTTAYYVILAQITIASGTTDITADNIQAGEKAMMPASLIDWSDSSQYEEIGRLTFTSNRVPNDTITLSRSDFNHIKIIARFSSPVANVSLQIRLNNDSSENSYGRFMLEKNMNAEANWVHGLTSSIANAGTGTAVGSAMTIKTELANTPNGWAGWSETLSYEFVRWGETRWFPSTPITTIDLSSSGNTQLKSGSEIVVYGAN